MTRLLIARHGNTFEKNETPRRVGRRTDLPLTEEGKAQARCLGLFIANYINEHNGLAAVYTSELKRTYEMAVIALVEAKTELAITQLAMLNEIDYGIDENKLEPEVVTRIGKEALIAWEERNIVPPGWNAQPEKIAQSWRTFARDLQHNYPQKTVLAITSNGIARFALSLLPESEKAKITAMKMATGAVSSFFYENGAWNLEFWNKKVI